MQNKMKFSNGNTESSEMRLCKTSGRTDANLHQLRTASENLGFVSLQTHTHTHTHMGWVSIQICILKKSKYLIPSPLISLYPLHSSLFSSPLVSVFLSTHFSSPLLSSLFPSPLNPSHFLSLFLSLALSLPLPLSLSLSLSISLSLYCRNSCQHRSVWLRNRTLLSCSAAWRSSNNHKLPAPRLIQSVIRTWWIPYLNSCLLVWRRKGNMKQKQSMRSVKGHGVRGHSVHHTHTHTHT